jgi:putrescine transport system ATP-binding protein
VFRSAAAGGEIVGPSATAAGGVAILVRPERIRIDLAPPEGADNVLVGTVRDSAFQGSQSTHRVALATGHVVRATRANAGAEAAIAPGAAVYVSWPAEAAVVLAT